MVDLWEVLGHEGGASVTKVGKMNGGRMDGEIDKQKERWEYVNVNG